jgi:hypothetical protein
MCITMQPDGRMELLRPTLGPYREGAPPCPEQGPSRSQGIGGSPRHRLARPRCTDSPSRARLRQRVPPVAMSWSPGRMNYCLAGRRMREEGVGFITMLRNAGLHLDLVSSFRTARMPPTGQRGDRDGGGTARCRLGSGSGSQDRASRRRLGGPSPKPPPAQRACISDAYRRRRPYRRHHHRLTPLWAYSVWMALSKRRKVSLAVAPPAPTDPALKYRRRQYRHTHRDRDTNPYRNIPGRQNR